MNLPKHLRRVECPEPGSREHVEPVEGLSWIYILWCRNRTLYVGQSRDIQDRLNRHSDGSGARHTKQLKSFVLVYIEGPMSSEDVVKRERQLKKWSRAKKLALIRGDKEELRRLSRSKNWSERKPAPIQTAASSPRITPTSTIRRASLAHGRPIFRISM